MNSYVEENIYFLTIAELKDIANKYDIPVHVYIEREPGIFTKSNIVEKKKVIIKKIFDLFKYKKMAKKTIYVNSILNFEKIDKITKNSCVYYGQYVNGNKHIFRLMRELTDNKFEFGVIAQNILHRQWVRGRLLTYGQLAKEWLKDLRTEKHPEWKYIDFIRQGNDIKDWKKTREQIAKEVLKQI